MQDPAQRKSDRAELSEGLHPSYLVLHERNQQQHCQKFQGQAECHPHVRKSQVTTQNCHGEIENQILPPVNKER